MFKFLRPDGTTNYDGVPFVYNLPRRGEKWARTEHPEPLTEPDGNDCGPGGLHLMRGLDAQYVSSPWWPWWARDVGLTLGESDQKVRTTAVELRRITPEVFCRALRLGWGKGAHMHSVQLPYADLCGANLSGATMYNADLRGTDFLYANLRGADFRSADLRCADFRGADLRGADFRGANLSGAIGYIMEDE